MQTAREALQALIDANDQPVFALDRDLRYTAFNRAHLDIMRALYGAEIALGGRLPDYVTVAADREATLARFARSLAGERVTETTVTGGNGHRHLFEVTHTPQTDGAGEVFGVIVGARDVTERRAAEAALGESRALLKSVIEGTTDAVYVKDTEGRYLLFNAAAERVTGKAAADVLGKDDTFLFATEEAAVVMEADRRVLEQATLVTFEETVTDAAGRLSTFLSTKGPVYDEAGGLLGLFGVARDVTEQKATEAALQERERVLSNVMGNLPGMAYRCENDAQWTMRFVSAGCEELTGYPPEALIANAEIAFADLIWPEDDAKLEVSAAVGRGEPFTSVYRITTASGGTKWVSERGVAIQDADGALTLEGIIVDVTHEREAEAALEAASAEWRRTFDAMRDSVAVFDHEGHLLRCNLATTKLTGRDFNDIIGRPCYEVFHGTHEYHENCPQLNAIASGRPQTSIFEQDGSWLRVTFEPEVDESGHVSGGVHVVSDISDLKESEFRLRESAAMQQRVTEGVIAALSRSVEVRDPYTSGHERRVSELATAMAQHMGLSEEGVRCVRVAGILHDLGKITVPAEILSKPGRLSEMEFALIKGHPQAGYEILESIEFHCPIATVVLQHHERLDGSGYPQGLSGENILAEARILAVADVVEAMSSHRPYRPALGMEVALAEVREHAGEKYDADVVRACGRLVEEQGFQFTP